MKVFVIGSLAGDTGVSQSGVDELRARALLKHVGGPGGGHVRVALVSTKLAPCVTFKGDGSVSFAAGKMMLDARRLVQQIPECDPIKGKPTPGFLTLKLEGWNSIEGWKRKS